MNPIVALATLTFELITRMHLNLASLPLGFLGLEPWMISIVIPVAGLVFAAVFLISGMYYQHRRRILWHETARIALEKGMPVPEPSPDAPTAHWTANTPPDPTARARGYLVGGLINLGIGAGLGIAFIRIAPLVSYIGAIPACIGVALLVAAAIESRATRQNRD